MPSQLLHLVEHGRFGHFGKNYCTKVTDVLAPITIEFQNELIEHERTWENTFLSGTILMGDARHGCPQRKNRTSSNCTNTILNERSGGVLGTRSSSRSQVIADGFAKNKSLDVHSSRLLYAEIVDKLRLIICYVHDGSTTGGKTVRDGSPSDAPAENQEDEWHLRKIVAALWSILMNNKSFSRLKKIPFEEIWKHITFAHKNGKGDPQRVQTIIMNAIQHYQGNHDNCLSKTCMKEGYELEIKLVDPKEVAAFIDFITKMSGFKSGKVALHSWGLSTNLCESIHNIMIKYAPKRIAFRKTQYDMRIAFAIIHYTENLKNKIQYKRSYVWQQLLKERYYEKTQKK